MARRELIVQGVQTYIGDRAFDVLGVLVQSAGQLVTKDELMRRVWPGTAAGENTLEVHVSALRKALGPERRLLKTAYARGYRLLGSWTAVERDAAPDPPAVFRAMARASRSTLPIAGSAPSVPMKMRHRAAGNLDLRARKDDLAHADAADP